MKDEFELNSKSSDLDEVKLRSRWQSVNQRLQQACEQAHRLVQTVTLLAVSKKQTAEVIRQLYYLGQQQFAESYLQEALDKMNELSDLAIEWHFIGAIQSRKAKTIADHFTWVHSVDRLKVAEKLSASRSPDQLPLNICLQVNIDAEPSKAGVMPDELFTLAEQVKQLPNLRLRGLMCIPKKHDNPAVQRQSFARMHSLFITINEQGYQLDTLSMGMSNDLEMAIQEGSTIVRIGTSLFGERLKI